MKKYYCTRDLVPTDNFHKLNWDANTRSLVPDMVTLLYVKGEIIGSQSRKMIISEFGKDAVSSFECNGWEYHSLVNTERWGLDDNCITDLYKYA